MAAAFGMERGSRRSKFEHLAGNQDTALGIHAGQSIDHGIQCFGVRIVAIVHQSSAGEMNDLAAFVGGPQCCQGRSDLGGRNTFLNGSRRGCKGVVDIVFAHQGQADLLAHPFDDQIER